MTCNKFFFTWQIINNRKGSVAWHFVHNGKRMTWDLRAKIQKYSPEVYKGISSEFPIATANGMRSGKLNWLSTALRTIFPSQTTLWLTRSSLKDHFFGRNSFEDLQYRSQTQSTMNTEYIFMKGKRDRGTMKKNKL